MRMLRMSEAQLAELRKKRTKAVATTAKPSKYGNVRTETPDGAVHASKREANRWLELLAMQKAGLISGLERQRRLKLTVAGMLICTYVADFCYVTAEGKPVIEDAKGYRTQVYKLKAKLVKAIMGIEILET